MIAVHHTLNLLEAGSGLRCPQQLEARDEPLTEEKSKEA